MILVYSQSYAIIAIISLEHFHHFTPYFFQMLGKHLFIYFLYKFA